MPRQPAGSEISLAEFVTALLVEREIVPCARLIANQTSRLLPSAGVAVYVVPDREEPYWQAHATVGDIILDAPRVEYGSGTLGSLEERKEALLFLASDLAREDYSHLLLRRSFASLAYIPMLVDETVIGAIEVISYEQPLDDSELTALAELAGFAGPAMASAIAYEGERNAQLNSISRLTDLYDLGMVLNSTLEMDELIPIVASKLLQLLNVQAVNLWMVDGEEKLLLVSQAGLDDSVKRGTQLTPGSGIASQVAESGAELLISDAEDERLQKRNEALGQHPIFSLIAAPLFEREKLVGVIEAINRLDGKPFDDDDLYLLTTAATSAAGALHNASLLNAERKVEILETLVKVSTEITSTLNLERVLLAVVNGPQTIIPYERAAIALEYRGKLQLKAVSGLTEISAGDSDLNRLRQILEWAAAFNQEILVSQREEGIDEEREETRAKFAEYFSHTGMRSFYVLPLADDQGRVGMLSFESSDPDFLQPAHLEVIKVLAAQATVALRNAALYREVPFIGILEPLLQKRARFLSLGRRRQAATMALAAAILLFLIFFPLPMRLTGSASVAPLRTAQVGAEVEGVVRTVYVHEGDRVRRGMVLAELEDWDLRSVLAGAEAKYGSALSEMNRALSANDGAEAGIRRIDADYWAAEVSRARERLQRARLRAPIDGVVATPYIENFAGRHLNPGEPFATVVDLLQASVDVGIDEHDVVLLEPGAAAAVKLDGFPTRTFKGKVAVVSPTSQMEGENHIFFARLDVPNEDGLLRAGMQGRGKISAGWHPAGYVFFRRTAMWFWEKIWGWFG